MKKRYVLKKEVKENIRVGVIGLIAITILLICLGKVNQEAYDHCINAGNSVEFCERVVSE